jgi:hypothetical protein
MQIKTRVLATFLIGVASLLLTGCEKKPQIENTSPPPTTASIATASPKPVVDEYSKLSDAPELTKSLAKTANFGTAPPVAVTYGNVSPRPAAQSGRAPTTIYMNSGNQTSGSANDCEALRAAVRESEGFVFGLRTQLEEMKDESQRKFKYLETKVSRSKAADYLMQSQRLIKDSEDRYNASKEEATNLRIKLSASSC